jgi:hypothetical protein
MAIKPFKSPDEILKNIDEIKVHLKKLFLLANKPAKDDVITSIAEHLQEQDYSPIEVRDACLRLYDNDFKTINFASIKSEIVRYNTDDDSQSDGECPYCKNAGTLGAKHNTHMQNLDGEDIFNYTVIACCCPKGQRLASKFGWHLWDKNPTIEDKKYGTLYVDEFAVNA